MSTTLTSCQPPPEIVAVPAVVGAETLWLIVNWVPVLKPVIYVPAGMPVMPVMSWPTARLLTSPEERVTVLPLAIAGKAADVPEAGVMTKLPRTSTSAAEVEVFRTRLPPRRKFAVPPALALQTGLASGVQLTVNLAVSAAKPAFPCVARARHWPAPVPSVRLKVPVDWKTPT